MNTLSYTDMLIAISNGKYSATEITNICNQYNITPEQLYTDLYGNENLHFSKLKNGTKIIKGVQTNEYGGYYGNATTAAEKANIDLNQALNSNNTGTTTKLATKPKIPTNSTLNSTGKVNLNTEIAHIGGQSITDGALSLQTVGVALAAVGVGIRLGKAIDSSLYNANPEFWDANGMSELNPATWGSITEGISEDDPLYARWSASAFESIFKTNPQSGEAQMYLTEDQIAYLTAFMIDQGVYAPSGSAATVDPTTINLYEPNKLIQPIPFNMGGLYAWRCNWSSSTSRYADCNIAVPSDVAVVYLIRNDLGVNDWGKYTLYFFSKTPQTLTQNITFDTGTTQATTITLSQITSKNGTTLYGALTQGQGAGWRNMAGFPEEYVFPNSPYTYFANDCGYTVLFGNITHGGIDGITDQEGATQFDASGVSDPSDIADVLAKLKAQFPKWFDATKGIRQVVIDENGDAETIDYYPVPIPDFIPNNLTQPTGGTDNATQQNPDINPDTWPESLIQTIAQILLQDPVSDDTDTINPPDTGSGDTPSVITPTGSASALFSVYNPTQAQVNSFGAWLWSNDFVEQLKKIFNDPMESIISLHKVFATPSTGTAQNIYVGYLNSNVSSATVAEQYTDVDCGTITLSEYFGNVYDYADTKVDLYLPFVGIVNLNVSDVMRSTMHIVYHVDVLTGACLVDVEVTRDASGGVLYQYSGDCAVHYPISAGSYMGIVTGILSIAGGIAGTIATGGAAAPALIGAGAAASRLHTDVSRSGGFSGNSGAMGAKKPYLIISRPQTALPESYLEIEGMGSNKTVMLNTCAGYTRIKEVYLQGIGDATEGELNELETLLKAGVVFPITEAPPNE